MNLSEYLEKYEIPVSTAAKEIGYSRQRLYQIISGERPGTLLILSLVDWSKNEISIESLLQNN